MSLARRRSWNIPLSLGSAGWIDEWTDSRLLDPSTPTQNHEKRQNEEEETGTGNNCICYLLWIRLKIFLKPLFE